VIKSAAISGTFQRSGTLHIRWIVDVVMQDGSAAHVPMFSLVARRPNSMGPRERRLVFGSIAFVSLVIAAAFAWFGAWPILPFAGAELAALYLAHRWVGRHSCDFERVAFEGEKLVVETRVVDRVRRFEFNGYWAQVAVRGSAGQCRVAIRSHGHEVQFGRLLSEQQCREACEGLARELRALR
jgi:uncharacterized membrane protein